MIVERRGKMCVGAGVENLRLDWRFCFLSRGRCWTLVLIEDGSLWRGRQALASWGLVWREEDIMVAEFVWNEQLRCKDVFVEVGGYSMPDRTFRL